jgi:hypothetical protein
MKPARDRGVGIAKCCSHRPEQLLTIGEVLAELRVARSTFDTWRLLGTAPACNKLPNGQLRISRSVLDAWLNAHVEAAEVA